MKTLLIFVFACISSVNLLAQEEQPMKFKKKAPEYIFLKKVEDAVKAHDADAILFMMEPEYKRMQHDEFLAGRTLQFLTEFFCYTIPFNDITFAQLISYKSTETPGEYAVRMQIKSMSATCYSDFYMIKNENTGEFSLYGAMG